MKTQDRNVSVVSWSARVVSIAFALFISIFATDVFSEGLGFWKTIGALLIHLVPTFLVIFILVLSWHHEWIGGIVYSALGICYLIFAWGRFDWKAYAFISGPLFILGILFFVGWFKRRMEVRQ